MSSWQQIQWEIAELIAPLTENTIKEIFDLIQTQKKANLGDLSLPCFQVKVSDVSNPKETAQFLANYVKSI